MNVADHMDVFFFLNLKFFEQFAHEINLASSRQPRVEIARNFLFLQGGLENFVNGWT